MKVAAISELKAKLSEYLRRVESGEEIVVLNHGRPVAKLMPIEPEKDLSHEEWVKELVRAGRIRPAKGKLPPDFWDRPRFDDPEGLLLKALLDERREGR